jgi:hypothetical protein
VTPQNREEDPGTNEKTSFLQEPKEVNDKPTDSDETVQV